MTVAPHTTAKLACRNGLQAELAPSFKAAVEFVLLLKSPPTARRPSRNNRAHPRTPLRPRPEYWVVALVHTYEESNISSRADFSHSGDGDHGQRGYSGGSRDRGNWPALQRDPFQSVGGPPIGLE